tara:strand:- start:454 stop:594 length:141 start_codon:yes stop_codon:yes gene_type:complete
MSWETISIVFFETNFFKTLTGTGGDGVADYGSGFDSFATGAVAAPG